jgi:ribonuclease HIII
MALKNRFDELKKHVQEQGWCWRPGKSIPHGQQIVVTDGAHRATINFYPKRGRLVVGGANSALKAALGTWIGGRHTPAAPAGAEKTTAAGGNRFEGLKAFIKEQGWNWGPGTDIPYGEQIVVSDAGVTALVNFWPKRGKMQVQGPNSFLKIKLQAWVSDQSEDAANAPDLITGPHIGLDEAGKGDWFGPLVVAAVYVNEQTAATLRKIGVRDSKALAPTTIQRRAGQIERLVPEAQRHIRVIEPERYNRLYAEQGNINLLLADAYAQAAEKLWQATQEQTIICDQFSQRAERLERAFAARALPQPGQQHRAESVSIAVAAASILASATFSHALSQLGWAAGLDGPLPKGSSDQKKLEATANYILKSQGREALGRYAKLNFKPIRRLLGQYV